MPPNRAYSDDDIKQMRRDIEIMFGAQGYREPPRDLVDERLQNYMAGNTPPHEIAAARQAAVNAAGKPVVVASDLWIVSYPDWRGRLVGFSRMIPGWVAWAGGLFLLIYLVNTGLK